MVETLTAQEPTDPLFSLALCPDHREASLPVAEKEVRLGAFLLLGGCHGSHGRRTFPSQGPLRFHSLPLRMRFLLTGRHGHFFRVENRS